MRDVVFQLLVDCPGHLEALAEDLCLRIEAASLEELQHEARDALIHHLGDAHGAYRVKLRRSRCQPINAIQPLGPGSAAKVPVRTPSPGKLR